MKTKILKILKCTPTYSALFQKFGFLFTKYIHHSIKKCLQKRKLHPAQLQL